MQTKTIDHKIHFVLNLLEEHGLKNSESISIIKKTFYDGNKVWKKTFPELFNWLSSFTNKKLAFSSFALFLNKIEDIEDKERFLKLFITSSTLRSCLTYIFSYSYLNDILFENPSFVFSILDEGGGEKSDKNFYNKEYLLRSLLDFLSLGTEEEAIKKLTFRLFLQFKKKHILRIASFNGIGIYSLEELGTALSRLADFILNLVLEKEKLKLGIKGPEDIHLSILALGRFALRTISYTDSYKILFVYENYEEINTLACTNHYNCCKLIVQRIVDFISPRKDESLYKLSFYKQSERNAYPIIYTTDQYIEHLENSQTIFSRYNMLNIRFSGGDFKLGHRFIERLIPLVYRRYLSVMELKGLRAFIANIFHSFDKKPILTIERMFNLLSLLYTSRIGPNPCNIYFLFAFNTLMTEEEKLVIKENYIFFKELKNQRELCNMQDWSFFFEQFDKIEENQFALQVCLSNLHTENRNNLKEKLIRCFEEMIYSSQSIFKNYFKDFVDSKSYFLFLLYQDSEYKNEDKEIEEFLASYGFLKPRLALSLLREIAPYSEIAKESFGNSLLLFLKATSANKILGLNIDSILVCFVKLVQSYKAPNTLFELFVQHPFLLKRILSIFANSSFLSELIISHPEFIEYLSDASFLDSSNSLSSLNTLLDNFLSFRTFEEAIVYLKNLESLRIGTKHILFLGDIKNLGFELSNLAEVILIRSFEHFYKELSEEQDYNPLDYAIIMFGKLGGREFSFGSDIDIYLVYEKKDEAKDRVYSNVLFYRDIISKLNAFFSRSSVTGRLYELDLKLRPEGRNSPLTVSFNKMTDYLLSSKDVVWERLVYTKARIFAPDKLFKTKIRVLVDEFISSFASLGKELVKKEVRGMRERIANNAIKKSASPNLFKKARGGLLDIEFLVEYLIINYGKAGEHSTNFFDMLGKLYHTKLINDDDYIFLKGALLFFRNVELVLRINTNTAVNELPTEDTKDFLRLVYRLNFNSPKEFLNYYKNLSLRVKDIFNKYFE